MLDVHVADTVEAASQNLPSCGFDAKIHELIFCRNNVPIGRFRLLVRMSDYYADTSFNNSELPELTQEIRALIDLLPSRNVLITTLEQFNSTCEEALELGQNIYLLCD